MVSRQDIRDINGEAGELIDAIDEMATLYEQSQKDGVTVDDAAYAEAQEAVKAAVENLWVVADDMVDRTDVYEPDGEGAADVTLPNAALERGTEASNKPQNPSQQ